MNNTTSTIARIVVIDDHGIVRYGYSQLINQEPGLEFCGMAGTEKEGIEMLNRLIPDVAIVDLSLKEGDGMDLIKEALSKYPHMKILVISAHDEKLFAHRVLAAGAFGFINKQEAPQKLIEGIQAVFNGEFYFSKFVTKDLIRDRLGNRKPMRVEGIESLTNRELQVFEQIGNGQSTKQISDQLYLSVKTIERYKENIKRKLNITHVTQLV